MPAYWPTLPRSLRWVGWLVGADKGTPVVLDRYWCSTLAYGRAFGADVDVASVAPSVERPDLTVLLLISDEERVRRLHARGIEGEEDLLTQQHAFRSQVQAGYLGEHPTGLGVDVKVDVSGADRAEALARLVHAVGGVDAGG